MEKITSKEYIFIFNSIHRVMKAERILKKKEIRFTLMPVPRQLSSDCGLCIRYTDNDYGPVKDMLIEQFADKVIAYEKAGDGYKKIL
jgi:hypothetical protein